MRYALPHYDRLVEGLRGFFGTVDQGSMAKLNTTHLPGLLRVSLGMCPHPHLRTIERSLARMTGYNLVANAQKAV